MPIAIKILKWNAEGKEADIFVTGH